MAIYSCNLKSIGRTTHLPGTAGAHIRYIARPEAQPVIIAQHMPSDPIAARNWIDRAERASRKNARVLDKIRLALPCELDEDQRAELVREFMADLTAGQRVPWFAALHQKGKDAHNPHVHIDVHDRGLDTGKRILRLSDSTRDRIKAGLPGPKAVDWIRERWEAVCNHALARAGVDARIDRRTLETQGVDRLPGIHEGPRASHINDNVRRPKSKARTNGAGRVIDYPAIDEGKTRREFNALIIDLNLERAIRSGNPEAAAWAQFEKTQAARDQALEKQLAAERRARTKELRTTSSTYTAQARRLRAEHRLKSRQGQKQIQAKFRQRRAAMRARHTAQRQALRKQQKGLMARITRRFSKVARARQVGARARQIEAHREDRRLLSQAYHQGMAQAKGALAARHHAQLADIEEQRAAHLSALQEGHKQSEDAAEARRQQREVEREAQRALTERKIQEWKKRHRQDQASGEMQDPAADKARREAVARAFAEVGKKEDDERKRAGQGQGPERER